MTSVFPYGEKKVALLTNWHLFVLSHPKQIDKKILLDTKFSLGGLATLGKHACSRIHFREGKNGQMPGSSAALLRIIHSRDSLLDSDAWLENAGPEDCYVNLV